MRRDYVLMMYILGLGLGTNLFVLMVLFMSRPQNYVKKQMGTCWLASDSSQSKQACDLHCHASGEWRTMQNGNVLAGNGFYPDKYIRIKSIVCALDTESGNAQRHFQKRGIKESQLNFIHRFDTTCAVASLWYTQSRQTKAS